MHRIAVVFQTTPGRITVHITDQPRTLIKGLCETRGYDLYYNSNVILRLYGWGYGQNPNDGFVAMEIPSIWHIDAYWYDEIFGNWIDIMGDFAVKAEKHDRVMDADDALMVIYSLDA